MALGFRLKLTIFRQLCPDLAATRGFGRGRGRLVGLGAGRVPIPYTNGYGAALRLLLGRARADHGKIRTVNR